MPVGELEAVTNNEQNIKDLSLRRTIFWRIHVHTCDLFGVVGVGANMWP